MMFAVKSDVDGIVHWEGFGEDTALFVAVRRTILRETTHVVVNEESDRGWCVTFDKGRRVFVDEVGAED